MRTWDTRFTGAETVAEGTMALRFVKPEGFAFKPGQAIDLVLDGDQRHTFSMPARPRRTS